jgi:MFS family permease
LTAPYAIVIDAVSFVVSTLFMVRIRRPETLPERTEGAPRPKMLPELKEGLGYVVRHPHLKWIAVCTGSSNFFGSIAFAVGLLYMARTLDLSAFWAGAVFAGYGVGSLVAALTTTRYQRLVGGIGNAIWISIVLGGIAGFLFPLAPKSFPIPMLFASTLLFGFGSMAYNISQVSYRQAITPERLQGRMNASMRWIVWGTMPIGSLIGGAIATATSLRLALWVGAIGGAFTFLPVFLTSVRTIKEMPEPVVEPTPAEATAAGGVLEPTSAPLTVDA